MPQLRSFSSFAQTPGIGAAYVGTQNIAQKDRSDALAAETARAQMANQFSIAAMETATRRQQLAQEAAARADALAAEQQFNEQKLAAQKEQLAQEMMIKSQDLEIDKFYKTGMLGIEGRKADMTAKEAARAYAQQDRINEQISNNVLWDDMTPEEAMTDAMQSNAAYLPPAVQAQMMRPASGAKGAPPFEAAAYPIKGAPGRLAFWNGSQYNLMTEGGGEVETRMVPDMVGQVQVGPAGKGGRVMKVQELIDAEAFDKQAEAIQKELSGDTWNAHRKALEVKRPTDFDKRLISQYNARKAEHDKLVADAAALRAELKKRWISSDKTGKASKVGKYTVIEE